MAFRTILDSRRRQITFLKCDGFAHDLAFVTVSLTIEISTLSNHVFEIVTVSLTLLKS